MTDLALLGMRFETQGSEKTNQALDQYADKARKAETAGDGLAAGTKRTSSALMQMLASIEKSTREMAEATRHEQALAAAADSAAAATGRMSRAMAAATPSISKASKEAQAAATHFDTLFDAADRNFATQYVRQMGAVSEAHGKGAKSSKAMTMATLDLSRQFADIGVSAAMGMNPLMILIQQGPQVADRLALMKAEGIGLAAAFRSMGAAAAPVLIPLAGIAAVVGTVAAGFGLMHRELAKGYPKDVTDGLNLTEEQLKRVESRTVTFGDTVAATFTVIGRHIMDGPVGEALNWLQTKFGEVMDLIAKGAIDKAATVVGVFTGAFDAIRAVWKMLPAVIGDAVVSAANLAIRTVEKLVNGAITAFNRLLPAINLLAKFNGIQGSIGPLGAIDLAEIANPNAGAMANAGKAAGDAFASGFAKGAGAVRKTASDLGKEIQAEALARARRRALDEAGDANKGRKAGAGRDAASQRDTSDERAAQVAAMLAQAKADELQAQLELTKDVRRRAELEKEVLAAQTEAKQAQVDRQIAAIEDDKGLTEATKTLLIMQLEAVKLTNARVGAMRQQKIDEEARRQLLQDEYAIRTAGIENEIDVLASQRELAKFAFQRREIDREILAAQQQIERLKLEEVVATTESGSRERQIAEARLKVLDAIQANERAAGGTPEDAFNDVTNALQDAARAFEAQDWNNLVNSLAEAFGTLRDVFTRTGATMTDKLSAVAGVVNVVGQAVGGKAGGALSGAASGAMAGSMFGPAGMAIGAVIGGIGGWLSSSKAEKAARNAEALKRAEEELARVRQIAAKRLDLEIELLEARGQAEAALEARHKATLAALDPSLRALQELIWAEQKLTEERQKAVDVAQTAVDDARARLQEAYDAEASALNNYIDRFRGWSNSLKTFLNGLNRGPAAMLSPEEQYRAARADFDRVSASAAAGNEDAIRDLETVSQAYLDASKAYYASSKAYFEDLARVRAAVTATQSYAEAQVSNGEQQLAALNASVSGILQVNQSVLSVRDALAAYQAAVIALAEAQAANKPAANDNVTPRGTDWTSYIANNGDVAAEYLRNMGSEKGRAYLAQLGIGSAEAFGQWHWNQYGKNEGRTPYATGGIMDRPITLGESGIGGEAGPEGILPLANVGGEMGVRASLPDTSALLAEVRGLREELAGVKRELAAANVQRGAIAKETLKQGEELIDETAKVNKNLRAA